MLRKIRSFLCNTDGAVTVDWVVLTAGIVAMAIFIISPYGLAPTSLADTMFDNTRTATAQFFDEE